MADRPSTLGDHELQGFLDRSRRVITRASVRTPYGPALVASPAENRSADIDTRTVAAAIVTLSELGDYQSARALCSFLLAVQNPSGAWVSSYLLDGTESTPTDDQDVTALAVWAVMRYIRASGDETMTEQAREHAEEAARFTRERTLNPYLYLVETTSSVHGPDVSEGYELWNNCAHAAAFALCHRVYGGERFRRLALLIRRAIGLLMPFEGRFLRRLDPSGYPDPRPDVGLIAPYYFGLWSPSERAVMNSAELIERTLWNVEIGGYIRFLPYSRVERSGLFGPSPRFTAWMAQYHYELGNKDRAEAIMRWLFDNAEEGVLADVLVPTGAIGRHLAEQRRGLEASSRRDRLAGYRERLLADLDAVDALAGERDIVPFGTPLAAAHLEALRALRKGGYLDNWQLDLAASRRGDEGPIS